MLRKVLCAAVALLICVGVILADELKGKVEKVDVEKKVIVVKVGEKDKKVTVGKDTKVLDADGKEVKDLKALEGKNVTVTYEKGDKEKKIPTKYSLIKIDK